MNLQARVALLDSDHISTISQQVEVRHVYTFLVAVIKLFFLPPFLLSLSLCHTLHQGLLDLLHKVDKAKKNSEDPDMAQKVSLVNPFYL